MFETDTLSELNFVLEFNLPKEISDDQDHIKLSVNHVIDVCNVILEDIWNTSDLIKTIKNSNNNTITFNYLNSIISIH